VQHGSIDAVILSLACRNDMVLTARQLYAAGLTANHVGRREGRLLTRVSNGIFVVGPLTRERLLAAALAALPAAAASHQAAASLHGLPLPGSPTTTVLVPGRTQRRIVGVDVRTTSWLPAEDVVLVDGHRITSVERTLCDLASQVTGRRLQHLIEHAVTQGLMTATGFQACVLGFRRRGRAGSGLVARLDHELLAWEPMPGSALERRATALFRQAGLGGWQAQYVPPWYDGVRGIVDLAWPRERVVVELDGRRWHATTQAQCDDRRRDRLALANGWVTLRYGWQEVLQRPDSVVEECRSLLAVRSAELARDPPAG
jgi:hypothetical protein